jgi:hypothetical protein
VKEEITDVPEVEGFQDISEEGIAEWLQCHSVILMNEELAWLDRQTYNGA